MRKLPVFATVRRAYVFLFGEIGTIFRLSWFAAALGQAAWTLVEWELGPIKDNALGAFVSLLVTVTAMCIVTVALHRAILFGERRPARYLHVDFGKLEFLFLLTVILSFVGGMAAAFLLVMPVVSPLIYALVMSHSPYAMIVSMAATFVLMLPIFYLLFRLFIIFPTIVVERRIDLARAWNLTKGNSWRFLAVLLLTDGVFYLADSVIRTLSGMPADSFAFDFSSFATTGVSLYRMFSQIVWAGLSVAALSYSYKFLSGHEADEILMAPQV